MMMMMMMLIIIIIIIVVVFVVVVVNLAILKLPKIISITNNSSTSDKEHAIFSTFLSSSISCWKIFLFVPYRLFSTELWFCLYTDIQRLVTPGLQSCRVIILFPSIRDPSPSVHPSVFSDCEWRSKPVVIFYIFVFPYRVLCTPPAFHHNIIERLDPMWDCNH